MSSTEHDNNDPPPPFRKTDTPSMTRMVSARTGIVYYIPDPGSPGWTPEAGDFARRLGEEQREVERELAEGRITEEDLKPKPFPVRLTPDELSRNRRILEEPDIREERQQAPWKDMDDLTFGVVVSLEQIRKKNARNALEGDRLAREQDAASNPLRG